MDTGERTRPSLNIDMFLWTGRGNNGLNCTIVCHLDWLFVFPSALFRRTGACLI